MKKNDMRMNRGGGARIGFQTHYANLSGLLKNRSLLENNRKKQAKNDQKVFRDKNFIQRNAKFAVRSEKRTSFLRVRNPRYIIFHASAVVDLISRPENCVHSFAFKILKVI